MDDIFLCIYVGACVILNVASDPQLLIALLALSVILIGVVFYFISERD